MANDVLYELYDVITGRRADPQEGSYTSYLFEKGLDKILKKVGEECAETIISAKNGDNGQTTQEICDLIYHLLVLMAERCIPLDDVTAELTERRRKTSNLKLPKDTDKNT